MVDIGIFLTLIVLVFDVNSAYFNNHGGYDFAKQFYTEAYKAAIKIVGGEQYILSAVMHADERNRAMSEALGEDVYHYHLHVVYIPVVEKEIRWTKRCKDKSLVGKVKETIMQVSMSKKWASKSILDEATGEPLCTAKGKPVLRKSYSVLQDDFFEHMRSAGYDNVERRCLLKLCKPFLLTLRLELHNSQMFLGTATLPALYIVIASGA